MATSCPCGSGRTLDQCCAPFIDTQVPAPTAEALMRSRYTAYVLGREDYLKASWHPDFRPTDLDVANDAATRWLGLEIRAHRQIDENHAVVEFVARYKIGGRAHRLHETSRFVREGGHWLYTDGDIHPK